MQNRKNMEVMIEYAAIEDLPVIMRTMHKALELVEDKSWYAVDSEEFVKNCIEKQGFTLKALVGGEFAGFLTVRYPWKDDDNLGDYIGLSDDEKMYVAHMESAAVLPEYRYVMGTAHPDNIFSVNNFLKLGYEIVADVKKYGGLRRYVFSQTI